MAGLQNNMTIIKQTFDNELFEQLYIDVFGAEYGERTLPDEIQVGYTDDGEPFGFMSGFWQYDKSFYIQFAGVVGKYRMKGLVKHFKRLLQEGVTYICLAKNDNVNAMKTLLLMGFQPFGGRITDDGYFVEWIRRA